MRSLALKEEQKLQLSENKVHNKILGSKNDLSEQFRILYSKEIHEVQIPPNTVWLIKCRMV